MSPISYVVHEFADDKYVEHVLEEHACPTCDKLDAFQEALEEAQGLAANLAQRLQEAKDRKVLLNGMTKEQKAAIFDIKALVSDGLRHYDRILRGSKEDE